MNKCFLLMVLFSIQVKSFAVAKAPVALDLSMAKKVASKATECANKNNWKFSIAIVNSEGNLIYFERQDESYSGSIDSAIQKAKSSNAFQRPTSAFVDGVKQGRLGLLSVKDVVAIEGGVPILIEGKYVGAIGLSGAKSVEDEQCAKAAVESIK